MIEGDKSHTSGWGWMWRINLDRKMQVFFFVMVRNTLKWACLNMFYSNCFLTIIGSGLSPSVKWECWKLLTRAGGSPTIMGQQPRDQANTTHPPPYPQPQISPPANFGALIKVHSGNLEWPLWTNSFGSRLWREVVGQKTCFTSNKKECFTKLL